MPCPDFRIADEFPADAGLSKRYIHKPALEIPDLICLTILDKRSNTYLQKSDKSPIARVRDKNKL